MGSKGTKKSYQNILWKEFREEIIELDGGACVRCKKNRINGAVLQVHHKKYISKKAPWEYPYELCETLCKGCHAAEHGIIRPEHGWDYVGEDDLGGLDGICDRCGTEIRYVFFVQHPHWEPMEVGTICCDDLTGTQMATESRKFNERLKRFYKSKRWGHDGDEYLIKQKQIKIRLYKITSGYKIQMNEIKGPAVYPTLEAAMKRTFEFIENGDADEFFNKIKREQGVKSSNI